MSTAFVTRLSLRAVALFAALALVGLLAGCGGSSTPGDTTNTSTTGTIRTSLSDPPTCKGPLAPSDLKFDNVWVTITEVRAHISDAAEDSSNGWQTLAELNPPLQIDLLSAGASQCILSQLGVTSGLPAGTYQQIRLHLLANNATSGPAENACAGVGGWNCAQESGGPLKLLNLSSQANTGIKIPPGRIAGGALHLEAGQAADINIEFNACNSVVEQGNGDLRLLPTLHAGEVSSQDSLSGKLVKAVDAMNTEPFTDLTGIVFLEQVDSNNIGRVMMTLQTGADGSFGLCPVPMGTFDIVAAGMDGSGVTYNATILKGVSGGAALGDIPLTPEVDSGGGTGPGEINGLVTTQDTGMAATAADIKLSPLQAVDTAFYTIPTFGNSNLMFVTDPNGDNGAACPDAMTSCFRYTLFVPASDPQVGTFNAGGTTYAPANATPEVEYLILGEAFVPNTSGQTADCSPSSLTADEDDVTPTPNPLAVAAGTPVTAETLAFTGCQAGF